MIINSGGNGWHEPAVLGRQDTGLEFQIRSVAKIPPTNPHTPLSAKVLLIAKRGMI